LDQKGQVLAAMFRNGVESGLDKYKLTPEEKDALLFVDEHIAAHRI
jgi:hypothetical protein